jgi:hypothetical protein
MTYRLRESPPVACNQERCRCQPCRSFESMTPSSVSLRVKGLLGWGGIRKQLSWTTQQALCLDVQFVLARPKVQTVAVLRRSTFRIARHGEGLGHSGRGICEFRGLPPGLAPGKTGKDAARHKFEFFRMRSLKRSQCDSFGFGLRVSRITSTWFRKDIRVRQV